MARTTISFIVEVTFEGLMDHVWSGAVNVLERAQEVGLEKEVMEHIADFCEMMQYNGVPPTDGVVNDFIWHELPYCIDLWDEEESDIEEEEE